MSSELCVAECITVILQTMLNGLKLCGRHTYTDTHGNVTETLIQHKQNNREFLKTDVKCWLLHITAHHSHRQTGKSAVML